MRPQPEYFAVGYYGLGFPSFLRVRDWLPISINWCAVLMQWAGSLRRFWAPCAIMQIKVIGFVLTQENVRMKAALSRRCTSTPLILLSEIFCCRTRCSSTEAKSTSGWKTSAWSCSLSSPTQHGWPAQRPLETTSATHLDSVSLHNKPHGLFFFNLWQRVNMIETVNEERERRYSQQSRESETQNVLNILQHK